MIKLLVMDVDGTLTDGSINIGQDGNETHKSFNVKDGATIISLECSTCFLTGRSSSIVGRRAEELKVDYVFQGVSDKLKILLDLKTILKFEWDEVAYVGDDLNDLECIELCGWSGCPADADIRVQEACSFVSHIPGGRGAVRDFVNYLINKGVFKCIQ